MTRFWLLHWWFLVLVLDLVVDQAAEALMSWRCRAACDGLGKCGAAPAIAGGQGGIWPRRPTWPTSCRTSCIYLLASGWPLFCRAGSCVACQGLLVCCKWVLKGCIPWLHHRHHHHPHHQQQQQRQQRQLYHCHPVCRVESVEWIHHVCCLNDITSYQVRLAYEQPLARIDPVDPTNGR